MGMKEMKSRENTPERKEITVEKTVGNLIPKIKPRLPTTWK